MLADQQRRVRCISAPAERPVEDLFVLETRQECRDGPPDADLGRVGICVCWMLGVGSGYRDPFRLGGAVGLMLLEPSKAREFIAHFNDPFPKGD